jgi:hypothetical protein
MKMISDAKARIWGSDSYRVTIVYGVSATDGSETFHAECEDILTTRRLTLSNYERVLNDMFYDFCIENASWMGVS